MAGRSILALLNELPKPSAVTVVATAGQYRGCAFWKGRRQHAPTIIVKGNIAPRGGACSAGREYDRNVAACEQDRRTSSPKAQAVACKIRRVG